MPRRSKVSSGRHSAEPYFRLSLFLSFILELGHGSGNSLQFSQKARRRISEAFATKFRAKGGRGELLELPGCDRGCGTLKELTPITSHSIALVGATLHLPGQASIR